jgi:hypothetical protein
VHAKATTAAILESERFIFFSLGIRRWSLVDVIKKASEDPSCRDVWNALQILSCIDMRESEQCSRNGTSLDMEPSMCAIGPVFTAFGWTGAQAEEVNRVRQLRAMHALFAMSPWPLSKFGLVAVFSSAR